MRWGLLTLRVLYPRRAHTYQCAKTDTAHQETRLESCLDTLKVGSTKPISLFQPKVVRTRPSRLFWDGYKRYLETPRSGMSAFCVSDYRITSQVVNAAFFDNLSLLGPVHGFGESTETSEEYSSTSSGPGFAEVKIQIRGTMINT
ncbi:hypothetical protein BDM02DRAFT_2191632 [Thelephora ganbajun]|uniref:Uncharacterized protein n=1 Tax=Thelephora ganbajun TaxID=370292 RepID=A0ACB6ZGP2_THEGA|nr:hypothetical protein BDM02DRAFT_2191632 [Thelephora ganbajun]